jgi:putative PIN family toxin of toxin-antitoxin system
MRVLTDANVFISYFLSSHGTGAIQAIFEAWSRAEFTLLVPEALLDEVLATVTGKPRLSARIHPELLAEFLASIRLFSEEIPRITEPIPAVTRDPKHDYLLAYALVGSAEYLVTGDEDLLALNDRIPELNILSPRQFDELLRSLR